jgi:hypothetical protein
VYSSSQSKTRVDWATAIVVLLAAGLLQSTLVHLIAVRSAVPSLLAVATWAFAVRAGIGQAMVLGALAGAIDDAVGGTGAAWTIATTIVALVVALGSRALFADSISLFTALAVVATLARDALFWAGMDIAGYPPGVGTHLAKVALLSAVYTGVVALIVQWARWRFAKDTRR